MRGKRINALSNLRDNRCYARIKGALKRFASKTNRQAAKVAIRKEV